MGEYSTFIYECNGTETAMIQWKDIKDSDKYLCKHAKTISEVGQYYNGINWSILDIDMTEFKLISLHTITPTPCFPRLYFEYDDYYLCYFEFHPGTEVVLIYIHPIDQIQSYDDFMDDKDITTQIHKTKWAEFCD